MLIQELFSAGIMTMGPSRVDPSRQVGVFNPGRLVDLTARRAVEMEKFRWIVGEWSYENAVPATSVSPAYTDVGTAKYSFSPDGAWICMVLPDGREYPNITFDPFSKQWIYLLTRGSYGILRSPQGWAGEQIAFSGLMTMIGINCEWRMTWFRRSDNQFSFVNEEGERDGSWSYIDEWRFLRQS
jgi:hypothetical protein